MYFKKFAIAATGAFATTSMLLLQSCPSAAAEKDLEPAQLVDTRSNTFIHRIPFGTNALHHMLYTIRTVDCTYGMISLGDTNGRTSIDGAVGNATRIETLRAECSKYGLKPGF